VPAIDARTIFAHVQRMRRDAAALRGTRDASPNRMLRALSAGPLLLWLVSCGRPMPIPPVAATTTTGAVASSSTGKEALPCVLECGTPQVAQPVFPDHHAAAVKNADEVFAAMHGDLLACYRARLAEVPWAHASIVAQIVVNEDGSVRRVETTGGAMFGERTMRCITGRIERATFVPVVGGGTRRIEMPLLFRTRPGDDT
jgi:hypothetical protein